MHAISSCRGNRPTNKQTNKHPQTHKPTHKPTDRTNYNKLRRSFASMQCKHFLSGGNKRANWLQVNSSMCKLPVCLVLRRSHLSSCRRQPAAHRGRCDAYETWGEDLADFDDLSWTLRRRTRHFSTTHHALTSCPGNTTHSGNLQ